ncbi:hypothetical protein [Streptomyces sp. NPDC058855]|uniref:hypothetical protein n=1 Tax=Streptomyces sp. NPDC058855 TaxID=3346651 RepID=UPI003673C2C7
MNTLTYWFLLALCFATEVWGIAIGVRDLTLAGALAGCGVIAVHRLLLRADAYEEFTGAGEDR